MSAEIVQEVEVEIVTRRRDGSVKERETARALKYPDGRVIPITPQET